VFIDQLLESLDVLRRDIWIEFNDDAAVVSRSITATWESATGLTPVLTLAAGLPSEVVFEFEAVWLQAMRKRKSKVQTKHSSEIY
jgi:hypothetical protein